MCARLCSHDSDVCRDQTAPYPDRFKGFCFMPVAITDAAAAELQRCVNSLGFVGALVDHNLDNGINYDGRAYCRSGLPLSVSLYRLIFALLFPLCKVFCRGFGRVYSSCGTKILTGNCSGYRGRSMGTASRCWSAFSITLRRRCLQCISETKECAWSHGRDGAIHA